jgi:hypothetical protein
MEKKVPDDDDKIQDLNGKLLDNGENELNGSTLATQASKTKTG